MLTVEPGQALAARQALAKYATTTTTQPVTFKPTRPVTTTTDPTSVTTTRRTSGTTTTTLLPTTRTWQSTTTTIAAALGVNAALSAVVSASSEQAATGQLASKAVDGVVAGYPGDYTKEWATVGGKTGSWVKMAWASARTVTKIVLHDRPNLNDQITAASISFSDGSTLSLGALANDGSAVIVTFPAKTITGLELNVSSVSGTTQNVGLAEIEVWTDGTAPAPGTTTTPLPATTTTTLPATTRTTLPATTTTTLPATTPTTLPPAGSFDLGKALADATPGAVITIPDGTYTGPWTVYGKSNLTLKGSANAVLTSHADDLLVFKNCAGINLSGFTVQGDYSVTTQRGITLANVTGATLENLTIRDVGFSGIYAFPASNVVIDNTTVTHCGDFGIHFKPGSADITVSNCRLDGFVSRLYPAHGIYFEGVTNAVAFGNVVTNVWDSPGQYEVSGIKYAGSTGHCYSNRIDGSLGGVSLPGATNVLVENNQISNMRERGVYFIVGTSNCTIKGNTFTTCSSVIGVYANDGASGNRLIGNTAINCPTIIDDASSVVENTGNSWN